MSLQITASDIEDYHNIYNNMVIQCPGFNCPPGVSLPWCWLFMTTVGRSVLVPPWSSTDLVPLGMYVSLLASEVLSLSVFPGAPPEVFSVSPAPSSFLCQICLSRSIMFSSEVLLHDGMFTTVSELSGTG